MTQAQANTPATVVVFRRWNDTGDVIALFPYEPENNGLCACFMHVGQHGQADFRAVVAASSPASALADEDVRDLAHELTHAPYSYHLKPLRAEDIK